MGPAGRGATKRPIDKNLRLGLVLELPNLIPKRDILCESISPWINANVASSPNESLETRARDVNPSTPPRRLFVSFLAPQFL